MALQIDFVYRNPWKILQAVSLKSMLMVLVETIGKNLEQLCIESIAHRSVDSDRS